MSLERAVEIGMVLVEAHRDLRRLGDCKKMLAAPELVQAFKDELDKRNQNLGFNRRAGTGELFFRGVPVVECEVLEGLEYAFVRGCE